MWLTSTLRLLIKARDDAWRAGKLAKYDRLKNEVIQGIKKAKARFLNRANASGAKQLWRFVKSFGRMSKKTTFPSGISAQDLSNYFAEVYGSESISSLDDFSRLMSDLPSIPLSVTVQEVEFLLNNMRKKSPGPDGIPAWVMKDLSFCIAPAVTHIFNRSLNEAHVPVCLKEALISPIPKKTKPTTCDNFRPISLLPLLSKVLEKLVLRHWFLPFVKSIDSSQFAYIPRPGSGCMSALTLLQHYVLNYLDSRSGAVRLLSLDYSKAFDTLPHASIIKSCIQRGIPIQAVNWVFDYLKDRRQRVVLGDSFSSWHSPRSGVPQGSILGPILFCCVISDLRPLHSNTKMIKYADDVNVLHFVRDASEDMLQDEFINVCEWSNNVGLQLNFSKCFVTNFVTSRNLYCVPIHNSSGLVLTVCRSVRILGVTFSDDLKWNDHVDNVVRKASQRIFILRNLKRSGCDSQTLYNIYVALIRSVLLYCYPCFCNAPFYLHQMLSSVERRVFKIVFGSTHYESDIFTHAEKMCESFFKRIHDSMEHTLRFLLFLSRCPSRSNSLTLRPPTAKTKRFGRSFIKFCKPPR